MGTRLIGRVGKSAAGSLLTTWRNATGNGAQSINSRSRLLGQVARPDGNIHSMRSQASGSSSRARDGVAYGPAGWLRYGALG